MSVEVRVHGNFFIGMTTKAKTIASDEAIALFTGTRHDQQNMTLLV